jgi:diguanylate cyclase (GGDEF)-like protein
VTWTWQPPRDLLGRVRLGFLVAVLVAAATAIFLILAADNVPLAWRAVGVVLVGGVTANWVYAHSRQRFGPIGTVLTAVALVAVGFSMGEPIRAAELIDIALLHQALFRSRRSLAATTAAYMASLGLSLVLAWQLLPNFDLSLFELVVQVPVVLLIAVFHILGLTIGRHERAALRERALATTGSALVAAKSTSDIYAAALAGAQELVAPHAAATVSLVIGTANTMRVVATVGGHEESALRDWTFDLTRAPAIQQMLTSQRPFEAGPEVIASFLADIGAPPQLLPQTVFVSPLLARGTLRGALSVATDQSLPDEYKDALTTLSTEIALALETADLNERLTFQAYHDPLTGLANRRLLAERVRDAADSAASSGGVVGLMVLDLDGFKRVNDSLGHSAGDRMLVEVAERLTRGLPNGHMVARLGGDEFAVLLNDLGSPSDAHTVAEQVLGILREPMSLTGTTIVPEGSMGLVTTSQSTTFEALLADADLAMYAVKRSVKGRYVVFDPSLREEATRQLEMEVDLRRALAAREFELYYQPIVKLASGELTGLEALIRWRHPERGLVSPAEFIPLAEETGLIKPLGDWVLAEACRQAREWQLRHPTRMPVRVGVNLSPRQLLHADLLQTVREVLAETRAAPELLTLELTEGSLIERSDHLLEQLNEIRALGVGLALDDFGTGYSSLAYLRDFPFHVVKIDRSFVNGVDSDGDQFALVQGIVNLAHALRMRAIAEGIETPAQAAKLSALGCDFGQGYHFARPMSAARIEEWLSGPLRAAA